jgi:UDP-hydrolysing UDP-N-acetyl-D-glucosamine 2-epimerase
MGNGLLRSISVVTTSRADYGCLLPILRRIESDPCLRLRLLVSGTHLSPAFGLGVRTIEGDGFDVAERIDILLSSDSPAATAKSMGLGVLGFAESFARERPDVLVVLGDRFEMHAAALAALPFRIPVAHVHGGEVTVGAFDDALRHSITKLSHLHFVATAEYARRLVQLGEEAWRVTVAGAPSLDNLRFVNLHSADEIGRQFGTERGERLLLVTFHPATLESGDPGDQALTLLRAVENTGIPSVVTMPNADPGGQAVRAVIQQRAVANPLIHPVESLGTERYFSLMASAAAMVGNSSSGIIEAASFGLPVVNIGSRQEGRVRGRNVIDVAGTAEAIAAGLDQALDPAFKADLRGMENPWGDGHAAERIVDRLRKIDLGPPIMLKRFVDSEPTNG